MVEAANVLRDSFRQSDILGIGGDEFSVVVTDAAEDSIATALQRVDENPQLQRTAMASLSPLDEHRYDFEPRGVGIDLEDLLHRADELMHQQKKAKSWRDS